MARIAPSILAADFSDLSTDIQQVSSVELLHLDVMDGHFVPNISFGAPVISSLRQQTDLYFDTHLMIDQPARHLDLLAESGVDRFTVHPEACADVRVVIEQIHELGADAGIAINPDTPVKTIEPYLNRVNVVLVMGVEPGFGGQEFMPVTLEKIERLAAITDTEIEVDGGIDQTIGSRCVAAGADTLVIGSALFGQPNVSRALSELRQGL